MRLILAVKQTSYPHSQRYNNFKSLYQVERRKGYVYRLKSKKQERLNQIRIKRKGETLINEKQMTHEKADRFYLIYEKP